jgi:uncharacterized protein with PQ loop repeat
MLIESILAGLFSSMNVWSDKVSDIRFHLNDVYMIGLMASFMILFHRLFNAQHVMMSDKPTSNISISFYIIMICIIICFVYAIRTQLFLNDRQYIKGMIPHHSMALHTSKHILEHTDNPHIKELAKNIIRTQKNEIELMKKLEQTI